MLPAVMVSGTPTWVDEAERQTRLRRIVSADEKIGQMSG
jgi:hypothetical protein